VLDSSFLKTDTGLSLILNDRRILHGDDNDDDDPGENR